MKFYNMINIFKKHPNEIGETYIVHFLKAFRFGIRLLVIAFRAFVHGLLPWCYEHTVSDDVKKLNDVLQERKKAIKLDES